MSLTGAITSLATVVSLTQPRAGSTSSSVTLPPLTSEVLPPAHTFDTSPKNSYTAWGPGYMLNSIPLGSNALAYKGPSAFFRRLRHPCSWQPGWSCTSPIETPLPLKRAHTAIPLVVLSLGWPGSREVAIYA